MTTRHLEALLACAATLSAVLLVGPSARAGGPIAICDPDTKTPFTWPTPHGGGPPTARYHVEIGDFDYVDNAAAVAEVDAAFAAWGDLPFVSIVYQRGPTLIDRGNPDASPGFDCHPGEPIDVDDTNVFCVFDVEDDQSPIVFDADGALFERLGLFDVLGFSGPEFVSTDDCSIAEGIAAFNARLILDAGIPIQDVLVHEFGHFSGLGHSATNGQLYPPLEDYSGPAPYDTFGFPPPQEMAETMYPFIFVDEPGTVATPHADDLVALATLYPADGFPDIFGTITGNVLASDGVTGLSGVNVITRNTSYPFLDARSAISGDFTQGLGPLGLNDGSFTLRGLTTGADYAVYVDGLQAGTFSVPPRKLPSPEEFYNGPAESSDPATDDPSDYTPITIPFGGGVIPNIDIILNASTDPREPNDDFDSATPITCPGYLAEDAAIDPPGDVDFYRLTGEPGSVVSVDVDAVIAGSGLDSVLGVFTEDGVLIAVSDDDPAVGEPGTPDSALIVAMPSSGALFVAVSAWDDFDFDGVSDGGESLSGGPYSLDVACAPTYADLLCPTDSVSVASGDTAGLIAALEAAQASAEDRTIALGPGEYVLDQAFQDADGPTGLPLIASSVCLMGDAGGTTTLRRADGAPEFRILHVADTGFLLADRLVITGGTASGLGAGIENFGTTVISSSSITRCESGFIGGGIENEGGLTLLQSSVTDNWAVGGGGIATLGRLTVIDSTIARNEAEIMGGIWALGRVEITNTTITQNTAYFWAGGIGDWGEITLRNTILADNYALWNPDCETAVSHGNNLVQNPYDCWWGWHPTDIVGEPRLGEFIDLGTAGSGHFEPLASSAALDAGAEAFCPATDQLARERMDVLGSGTARCDIGAIEFTPSALDPSEPNDDLASATPIACSTSTVGTAIEPLGDVDYFVLDGPPRMIAGLDIDAHSTLPFNSVLGVFDSSGSLLGLSDDDVAAMEDLSGDSYVAVSIPDDGLLYVAVAAHPDMAFEATLGETTGPYNLSVTCTTAPPPGALLASTGFYGTLFEIDLGTGRTTERTPRPSYNLTEIEFREDGALFAVVGAGFGFILQLHPATGAPRFHCSYDGTLNGLEFVDGVLYGSWVEGGGQPSYLVIVEDPVDGVCPLTFIGPTGFSNIGGLAYDRAAATLYGCTSGPIANGDLLACDLGSGACTRVGPTGIDRCSALEFGPDGTLYAGAGGSSDHAGMLLTVDPETGTGAELFRTDAYAISGLAFVPCADVEYCDNGIDDNCNGLMDSEEPCVPLLAVLESFTAEVTDRGVLLEWRTTMEIDHAGFRITRGGADGVREAPVIVTPQIIPARGTELSGAHYEFLDDTRQGTGIVHYYLESIDIFGEVERHGPVVVILDRPVGGQAATRQGGRGRQAR